LSEKDFGKQYFNYLIYSDLETRIS